MTHTALLSSTMTNRAIDAVVGNSDFFSFPRVLVRIDGLQLPTWIPKEKPGGRGKSLRRYSRVFSS